MSSMLLRSALFLVVFSVLRLCWHEAGDGALARWWIERGVVAPAVGLIDLLTPAVQARGLGARIVAEGGGLQVLAGCEGTELLFLLAAGAAVVPIGWRRRVAVVVLGALFAAGVNLLRILVLFYVHRDAGPWFDLVHGTLAPFLLVAVTVLFFRACLTWPDRSVAR